MEDAYSSNMSDLSSVGKNDPSTDLQNQHATGGKTILISYYFLIAFLLSLNKWFSILTCFNVM